MSPPSSRLLGSFALSLWAVTACGGGSGGSSGSVGGGDGGGGNEEIEPDRVPDLGTSEFHVTPAFGTPADGRTTVDIQLSLISLLGRPIPGAVVELDVSGWGNLAGDLSPTDAEGRTRGTLASTVGEQKTIVARTRSGGRVTEFAPRTAEFLLIPDHTFFVRATGSDASSGRSPREAWQTLAHAVTQLGAGDTLHVGAGLYPGALLLQQDASAGNPLVIWGDESGVMTGDPGAVVIDAGGSPWALRVLAARNLVLSGLTLRGAEAGLRLEGSAAIRVLACNALENGTGIVIQGADGLVVQDCRVSANLHDGIRVEDARDSRIENNLVYGNGEDGLVLGSPAEGTTVRFNTFHRNGGHHLREEAPGGSGAIRENILTEGGADAIALAGVSGYETGANMLWGNPKPGPSRGLPQGSIEADPLFVDPFGPDGILGGIGAQDDDFRLLPGSVAHDLGSLLARDVVLGSQEPLSTRSTRADGLLEWSGSDLPATNLGYHWPLPVAPFRSLARGGGRIALVPPGEVRLHGLGWDRAVPASATALSGPGLAAEVVYLEQRISPVAPEELVAAQVDTGTRGQILVRHWDGRRWSEPALAPFQDGIAREELAEKRFDVEFEGRSGRALFVLADDDGIPSYRVLDRGGWSAPRQVADNPAGGGRVRVVELVPRVGTNDLALLTLDDRRDLVATLWDGAGWSEQRLLAANTIFASGWRPFDAAFESLSGDLLVAWGFNRFAEETRWATHERTRDQWRFGQHPSTEAVGAQILLASDPGSNRIALTMGEGSFDNDVTVSMWNGTDWVHTAELTLAGPIENRLLELTWLGDSGMAAAVFRRQGHTGSFNLAFFLPTGWRIQPDVVLPGVEKAAKVRLVSPEESGELLGLVLDVEGRLFGFRFDHGAYSLLNGALPLATGLDPRAPGRAFDVALQRTVAPAQLKRK
jgi:parallel beta-helix repeat protein